MVCEWGQLQVTTSRFVRSVSFRLLLVLVTPTFGQQPAPSPNSDSNPIATTLCEVVAHPEKFSNKFLRFQASFDSDGLDHSILIHRGCRLGIVPYSPADGKKRPDFEEFEKAIDTGAPGTLDKTVVAIFTGRFIWKPPSTRILEIEGVSELRVSPLKGSPGRPKKH
jgi:hypothetical protein